MKEEIKNLKAMIVCRRFQSLYRAMLSYCLKCRKNTEKKSKSCKDKKQKNNASINMYKKKTKKESKNLKKQEIHDIFIKVNYIELVFNVTRLMEVLKI